MRFFEVFVLSSQTQGGKKTGQASLKPSRKCPRFKVPVLRSNRSRGGAPQVSIPLSPPYPFANHSRWVSRNADEPCLRIKYGDMKLQFCGRLKRMKLVFRTSQWASNRYQTQDTYRQCTLISNATVSRQLTRITRGEDKLLLNFSTTLTVPSGKTHGHELRTSKQRGSQNFMD